MATAPVLLFNAGAIALLDTSASVNVLPYEIGLQLGAVWQEQTVPIQLSGNLACIYFRAEWH
ncbi:hypothetical protein [uncultured Nostoc sp.]|uniref:hypothetical protein n=1 Tax=uncultured Nostoc sp. TaxID=340711 RepID=UPI0035CAF2DF